MENSSKILKLSARFMSATFLSRVFGMTRDVLMAAYFGATPLIAAFFVAYRLSNLFRRIFAEGGLLNGFIPFFEEIRLRSEIEGAKFFRDLLASVSLVLLALIAIFLGGLELCRFLGINSPVIDLSFVMLPSILFICLFGVFSAYLQCHHRFFISGAAPIMLNLCWIGGIFAFRDGNVVGLCYAILLGFALQFALVALASITLLKTRLSLKEFFTFRLFPEEVKKMIAPFFVAAIGVSAVQVNSALDGVIARMASLEGPAYLTFANRIAQLPLGLFAVGVAVPLLPLLSKAFHMKDQLLFNLHLQRAFERSLFFIIPSVFGIFAVGQQIIALIYGRGAFDGVAIVQTTYCFYGYALSLIPSAFVILIAPIFYSQKNYKDPAIAACASVLCNIAMSLFLVLVLKAGPYSIALSSSFSSLVNAMMLARLLKLEFGRHFWKKIVSILGASLLSFLVVKMIPLEGKGSAVAFLFGFVPFVTIYFASFVKSWLTKES